jgi:hypothetical protein
MEVAVVITEKENSSVSPAGKQPVGVASRAGSQKSHPTAPVIVEAAGFTGKLPLDFERPVF